MVQIITQTDAPYLSQLGADAVALFATRDFQAIADRFGYALAYDRSPALAIEQDYQSALTKASGSPDRDEASIVIKYFQPGNTHLHALIECVILVDDETPLLVELIVATSGKDLFVMLEDISPV
ncbi:MAG TPA: hypothetical protein VM621_08825 [Luteibacter sp.]|uniref:hypothetical protein n=1 Tax=Luteibacter sp. TaxID=1886636 RepID=UPI002C2D68DF|nr:hypothetical protein [Luteibacter sp.]HVI55142.1 hypothetical protein [Luteibacter sp.]